MCGSPTTSGFSENLGSLRASVTRRTFGSWGSSVHAQKDSGRPVSVTLKFALDLNHCRWESSRETSTTGMLKISEHMVVTASRVLSGLVSSRSFLRSAARRSFSSLGCRVWKRMMRGSARVDSLNGRSLRDAAAKRVRWWPISRSVMGPLLCMGLVGRTHRRSPDVVSLLVERV